MNGVSDLDDFHVHEILLSRLTGQIVPLIAVLAIRRDGGRYVKICWQDLPDVGAYASTEEMTFVDAWYVAQWGVRIKYLNDTTLIHIACLVTGGELDKEDLRNLAVDLGEKEEGFIERIRQRPKPSLEPEMLHSILWRLPDNIRFGVGREMIDAGWIEESEIAELLHAPEALPFIATPTARHSSRFGALLRSFWPL